MEKVQLGDIVLYHDPETGQQFPAMITKLESQESAVLAIFGPGQGQFSAVPKDRGNQPGQWEPRPKH